MPKPQNLASQRPKLVLDQGYSAREVAEAMGVGKSTLDKWVRKRKAERGGTVTTGKPITEDQPRIADLEKQVKRIQSLSNGSAGARTIATISTTEGLPMSRYVASKRMRELQLFSCQLPAHRYQKTGNAHVAIPNLLNREFTVGSPNQVWCGDVTYIWTGKRWSYLAVVLDLYARQVVGWAISNSPDSELTAKALRLAYE